MGLSTQTGKMAVDLLAVLPGGTNGGAKLLIFDLLEGLSDHWVITCFCRPGLAPEIAGLLGDRVRTVAVAKPADLSAAYDAQVEIDGPFAANLFPMQRVSLQRPGTPAISIVHDLQFIDIPENFTPGERAERADAFHSCVEYSDLIIAVSHFSKMRISTIAEVDDGRIKVIHNAPKIPQPAPTIPEDITLNSNGFFLYPANFWPHKNHNRLLAAYQAYREAELEPLDLVLTGEPGVGQGQLAEVIQAQSGVVMTGFVERAVLQALMERATALVFPSLYEGFGMPLMEAMAAGTPIACSDAGSLPEVAGRAAILFNGEDPSAMADAMVRLAGDAELRTALVKAGEARLTQLGGFQAMRDAYRAAIEAVIAAPAEPGAGIEGVDQDGWAGPDVTFILSGAMVGGCLQLQLALPIWAPLSRQRLTITSGPRVIASKTLWPGKEKAINLVLLPGEHSISITAPAAFRSSDALNVPPKLPVAYKLQAASALATGRRWNLWPEVAEGTRPLSDVVLLAIAGQPQESLTVSAVGVSADGVPTCLIPSRVGDSIRFECRHAPAAPVRDGATVTQVALPRDACFPTFEFSREVHTITFRTNDLAAPAVIRDARTERGFSVIVPSFNQGRFIARTIDSILSQDHLREVLVLDGGSTDETLDILASYGSRIVWSSGKDGGQADAVNRGMASARGDYIAWINSDDTYAPNALAHVATIFESRDDVGVVYGNADHIDEADRHIEAYPTSDFDPAALLDRCFISQPATFFRRYLAVQYGGLRETLRYCLDYEFWLRLSASGVTFLRSGELLAHSRMYAENKTMGERVHAYFETADMMIRGMGYREGQWIEHFANAAADFLAGRHGIPRAFALREARNLAHAIWSSKNR